MRFLLDTHVMVWAFDGSAALGAIARRTLRTANERWISTISTLEIARLVAGGDIVLACSTATWVERAIASLNLSTYEITHPIAIESYSLPKPFHRDPADRILVATARIKQCVLLTADERILAYPHIATIDARK